jgi:hypothetical protein
MIRSIQGQPEMHSTTTGYTIEQGFGSDQQSLNLLNSFFKRSDSDFLKVLRLEANQLP